MFTKNGKYADSLVKARANKVLANMPLWEQLLYQFYELPKDSQDEILYRIYKRVFTARKMEIIFHAKA